MDTIITKENMTIRQKKKELKKAVTHNGKRLSKLFAASRLLTQTEFFNDSTISFDIFRFQVIEQATTLTYQHC